MKSVSAGKLTGSCWLVQVWGTNYCESCEYKDTPDCGGQEIRAAGKNEKGIKVGKTGL